MIISFGFHNRRSHQGIAHQIPMERYKNAA